jgi:hypothetical protein
MRNKHQVRTFFSDFSDKGDKMFRRLMGGIVLTGAGLTIGSYLKDWNEGPPEIRDTPDYIEALLAVKALLVNREEVT